MTISRRSLFAMIALLAVISCELESRVFIGGFLVPDQETCEVEVSAAPMATRTIDVGAPGPGFVAALSYRLAPRSGTELVLRSTRVRLARGTFSEQAFSNVNVEPRESALAQPPPAGASDVAWVTAIDENERDQLSALTVAVDAEEADSFTVYMTLVAQEFNEGEAPDQVDLSRGEDEENVLVESSEAAFSFFICAECTFECDQGPPHDCPGAIIQPPSPCGVGIP